MRYVARAPSPVTPRRGRPPGAGRGLGRAVDAARSPAPAPFPPRRPAGRRRVRRRRHVAHQREVAGHELAVGHLADLRLLGRAALLGPRAAGPEPAPARRGQRRRQVARHQPARPRPGTVGVGHRDRRQQRRGVGVGGRGVEPVGRRHLADLAEVHHRHPVADVLDHRQVVGDEHQRQAVAGLQVLEQVEDLGLHRHVEGRHRLVADDQLGLEHQGPGDGDALALAARELVRPLVAGHVGVEARRRRAPRRPWPGARPRCPDFQIRSGSATMSPTLRRGFSDEIGSWKMIWICGRRTRSRSPSARSGRGPSKRTGPPVGAGSCMTARPVVDLPQPDSPTRPSVSPSATSKLMSATA